jgi:hypothetical protein
VIVQGRLRFSFTFNQGMKQQEKISKWISSCRQTVHTMATSLAGREPQASLSDFPLLSLDYGCLGRLVDEVLPKLGITSIMEVEDVYPCSSMQQGLLISQTKDTAFYAVQIICELKSHVGLGDKDRLANAWKQVVTRHPSLRTVFIESVTATEGFHDQAVLKPSAFNPKVEHMSFSSEKDALHKLSEKRPMDNGGPPHRLTICSVKGKLLVKLEISHCIMDGESMSIILRDLALAYDGQLSSECGPLYSDYIEYVQNQPRDLSIEFWRKYLKNIDPCIFPCLNDGIFVEKQLKSSRLDFPSSKYLELKKFCDNSGITFSNALHAAWGLTLRCYTESDDVCFGFLASGRDIPIPGIENAVGAFISMLVCRMRIEPASRITTILEQTQRDYIDSLQYRHTSLAELQHTLSLSGGALFNTALSYQRLAKEQKPNQTHDGVSFEEIVPIYDPTEYSLSINIVATDDNAVIDLDYWTDQISEGQSAHISSTFLQALNNIVHRSQRTIGQLDNIGEYSLNRIMSWNSNVPDAIEDCVHSVIEKKVKIHPMAPAICAWDADLSYAELDDLSTRLAHYLVKLGLGAESFVPTCFDKSAYHIVASLGILKSGAVRLFN